MFVCRQLGEQEVLKNQNISKLESSGSVTQQLEQENETYRYDLLKYDYEISFFPLISNAVGYSKCFGIKQKKIFLPELRLATSVNRYI